MDVRASYHALITFDFSNPKNQVLRIEDGTLIQSKGRFSSRGLYQVKNFFEKHFKELEDQAILASEQSLFEQQYRRLYKRANIAKIVMPNHYQYTLIFKRVFHSVVYEDQNISLGSENSQHYSFYYDILTTVGEYVKFEKESLEAPILLNVKNKGPLRVSLTNIFTDYQIDPEFDREHLGRSLLFLLKQEKLWSQEKPLEVTVRLLSPSCKKAIQYLGK